ncbi:MAG: hypothetical protein U5M51_04175 [Emticicia sp.]|nr:hypothetical protein [Emticicia sp.]
MQTLELKINIEDEVIAQAGVESLRIYLEKAAENFKFNTIASQLREIVGNEEQIDADFQIAKKEAWETYKEKYMPDSLKEVINRREKK